MAVTQQVASDTRWRANAVKQRWAVANVTKHGDMSLQTQHDTPRDGKEL